MRDALLHNASTDEKALLLKKSVTVVSHWCFHCMKTVASSDSGIVGKAKRRLVTRFRSFYLILLISIFGTLFGDNLSVNQRNVMDPRNVSTK